MKKQCTKWGLSVVLALILLIFPILCMKKSDMAPEIVFLGDSICGNAPEGISIPELLGKRLSVDTYNAAMGGTSLSYYAKDSWESAVNREWCLARLVDAICFRDFRAQKATLPYGDRYRDTNLQTLDYFPERLDGLARIDFSRVRLLVIWYGANDYGSGQPLDNPLDDCDRTTFGGALRYSLTQLREKFPELRILIVSPIYNEMGGESCLETDRGGGCMDAYVKLEKEIAEAFDIEWLNAFDLSGIREDTADFYLGDGLHLTNEGRDRITDMLAEYLEGTD